MRLGEVVFKISYVIDIDDEAMIDRASARIIQDLNEVFDGLRGMGEYAEVITDKNGWFDESDIPEFLKEKK